MLKEDVDMYKKEKVKFIYGKHEETPYIVLLFKDSPRLICKFPNDESLKLVLSNFEKTVSITTIYNFILVRLKWRKMKDNFKIIQSGTCSAVGQDPSTYIINDIKGISGVKNDSNLIIRFDQIMKGTESKITNEPSNKYKTYFRLKAKEAFLPKRKPISSEELPLLAWASFFASIAITLIMTLGMAFIYLKISKRDKILEDKLFKIINQKFKVRILKDPAPNAFCMIAPVIFMTDSLKDMLTEKEVIAVLIHEASHINNKDVIKGLATTNGFIGLLLGIATMAGSAPVFSIALILYVACKVLGLHYIVFDKTFGRHFEKRSDSLAAKYGYGKEMISALAKIHGWMDKVHAKRPCGVQCNLLTKFGTYIDAHPSLKERVENILKSEEDLNVLMGDSSHMKKVSFLKSRLLGE